jgi:hypothetical protein
MNSAIYEGTVMHERAFPRKHRFTYRVYYLWLDLDELPLLDRTVRGFGFDRVAPFSFHSRDHGPRTGERLRPWIERALDEAGIRTDPSERWAVRILTMPRVMGYQFNPLSVWCCYDPTGAMRAVLYEVSNTHGEWHHYLHPVSDLDASGYAVHVYDKELFVSPFIDLDATYTFRVRQPEERAAVLVRERVPEGEVLKASFVGKRRALTSSNLWKEFARYPLVTAKVTGLIHFEAVRLWCKGAPFRRHAGVPVPIHQITAVSPLPPRD